MAFHIPNGGKRSRIEAAILSRFIYKGASDVCIILPPKGRAGFIELKAPKERISAEQVEFLAEAKKNGALADWTDNIDDFMRLVDNWIAGEKNAEKEGWKTEV